MKKRLMFFAALVVASIGLIASFGGVAAADTISPNPITFESSQSYIPGNIDLQQGWTKSGSYDAAVASVSAFPAAADYGFESQALRISDSVTSGSFGDQTFSPGLAEVAGETPAQTHFAASFKIGSATGAPQDGLHVSVSPDNGSGGRMSYLRFEDQLGGIAVFFDDTTDAGPLGTVANFSDTQIATLSYGASHAIGFSIDFKPGPANDVVTITVDGSLKATGTTWEDYYRYDPEQTGNGNVVPGVSKLLFREGGTPETSNAGNGYLIDDVSLASSTPPPPCTPTGFYRDGINLTAAKINPAGTVTGNVDASGCNIGVYYGPDSIGTVGAATISGANYYGVVVDRAAVNVNGATIRDIGEPQPNGSQHGVGVLFTTIELTSDPSNAVSTTAGTATGTLSGSTISRYQKNGVVVSGTKAAVTVSKNTVTGFGPVNYIAQNGIEIAFGGSALVTGNTVSGHFYTPATVTACGLLFYQAGGVKQNSNTLFGNQTNVCNAGRGGGGFNG